MRSRWPLGLVGAPALAAERVETIRLIQTRLAQQTVDLGRRGASAGDLVYAAYSLTQAAPDADRPVGGPVGSHSRTRTTLVGGVGSVAETSMLANGSITAGGVVGSRVRTLAVLGGTGAFANAQGTLSVKPLDPRRTLLEYTLVYAEGGSGPAGTARTARPDRARGSHGSARRRRRARACGRSRARRSRGASRPGWSSRVLPVQPVLPVRAGSRRSRGP